MVSETTNTRYIGGEGLCDPHLQASLALGNRGSGAVSGHLVLQVVPAEEAMGEGQCHFESAALQDCDVAQAARLQGTDGATEPCRRAGGGCGVRHQDVAKMSLWDLAN